MLRSILNFKNLFFITILLLYTISACKDPINTPEPEEQEEEQPEPEPEPEQDDTTPPAILAITPADGSDSIFIDEDLIIVFNDNLDGVTKGIITLNGTTYQDNSNCTITFSKTTVDCDTVIINPYNDLDCNISYSILDIRGFKDKSGNTMVVYTNEDYAFMTNGAHKVVDENEYRIIISYYDEDGFIIKKHQINYFGPIYQREIITLYEYDSSKYKYDGSKKLISTESTSQYCVRTTLYNTDEYPVTFSVTIHYGLMGNRSIQAYILQYNIDEQKYIEVEENTQLEKRVISFNSNGDPELIQIFRNFGPPGKRESLIEVTVSPNTGLFQQTIESNQLESLLTSYNEDGLPTNISIQRNFGPIGKRESLIEVTAFPDTGLFQQTLESNQLENRLTSYNEDGLPTNISIQRNFGPSYKKTSNIQIIANIDTGLYKETQETCEFESRKTKYNSDGLPISMVIQRNYGPSWTRNANIELTINEQTGLVKKVTEINSKEAFLVDYDSDYGCPIKITVKRNYGPESKRDSTIYLNFNKTTNIITSSEEISSYGVKKIKYDENGFPVDGVLYVVDTKTTWFLTFISDVQTGFIISETAINSSETERIITKYDNNGVPILKSYYSKSQSKWLLDSEVTLSEGDEITQFLCFF